MFNSTINVANNLFVLELQKAFEILHENKLVDSAQMLSTSPVKLLLFKYQFHLIKGKAQKHFNVVITGAFRNSNALKLTIEEFFSNSDEVKTYLDCYIPEKDYEKHLKKISSNIKQRISEEKHFFWDNPGVAFKDVAKYVYRNCDVFNVVFDYIGKEFHYGAWTYRPLDLGFGLIETSPSFSEKLGGKMAYLVDERLPNDVLFKQLMTFISSIQGMFEPHDDLQAESVINIKRDKLKSLNSEFLENYDFCDLIARMHVLPKLNKNNLYHAFEFEFKRHGKKVTIYDFIGYNLKGLMSLNEDLEIKYRYNEYVDEVKGIYKPKHPIYEFIQELKAVLK